METDMNFTSEDRQLIAHKDSGGNLLISESTRARHDDTWRLQLVILSPEETKQLVDMLAGSINDEATRQRERIYSIRWRPK